MATSSLEAPVSIRSTQNQAFGAGLAGCKVALSALIEHDSEHNFFAPISKWTYLQFLWSNCAPFTDCTTTLRVCSWRGRGKLTWVNLHTNRRSLTLTTTILIRLS